MTEACRTFVASIPSNGRKAAARHSLISEHPDGIHQIAADVTSWSIWWDSTKPWISAKSGGRTNKTDCPWYRTLSRSTNPGHRHTFPPRMLVSR